jgi:hypothetical protein
MGTIKPRSSWIRIEFWKSVGDTLNFVVNYRDPSLSLGISQRNPYGQCRQPERQQYPRRSRYFAVKTQLPFSM